MKRLFLIHIAACAILGLGWYGALFLLTKLGLPLPFLVDRPADVAPFSYEKYNTTGSSLLAYAMAGALTGSLIWPLRKWQRTFVSLILQSGIVSALAVLSFWIIKLVPELFVRFDPLAIGELLRGLIFFRFIYVFLMAWMLPVLFPFSLLSILLLRLIHPQQVLIQTAAKKFSYVKRSAARIGAFCVVAIVIVSIISTANMVSTAYNPLSASVQQQLAIPPTIVSLDVPQFSLPNDRLDFLKLLSRSSLWHVLPRDGAVNPKLVVARRRYESLYSWNGQSVASPPDPYSGSTQTSLDVEFGIGEVPASLGGLYSYYGSPKRVQFGDKIKLTVQEDSVRDYFTSHVVVVGTGFWIRVYEGSADKTRQVTQKILSGLIAELLSMEQSVVPENSSTTVIHNFTLSSSDGSQRFGQYRGITGTINMGRAGTLCHVVTGDRVEIPLKRCGYDQENAALVSWSSNPQDSFTFFLPAHIPGPGDGEPYPWQHSHELWFIPFDGSPGTLLAKGESTQGRLLLNALN